MKRILLCVLFLFSTGQAKQIDELRKSTLHYFNGLYVLDLHGSREEMNYAHGFFAMKHVAAFSPVQYYSQAMDTSLKEKLNGGAASFVAKAMDILLKSKMDPADESAMNSFAQGMGVPQALVRKMMYYPDFSAMLAAHNYSSKSPFVSGADFSGSTILVSSSDKNPGVLFGRNLDGNGVGFFDRYPAIIYFNSTAAAEQNYIQVTSLGVLGAHTAYNQSGLMISLHSMSVNQVSVTGDLISNVVDEIARRAYSLEDAKEIIESKRFTTAWKIIIGSEKENSGFVAEVSPKAKHFYAMENGGIGDANQSLTPSFQKDEFAKTYNFQRSSMARKGVMQNAIEAGQLVGAESMIDLLRTRHNPGEGDYGFLSLSRLNNLMSVVISASEKKIYMAVANRADTKPSEGGYVQMPLEFGLSFLSFTPKVIRPASTISAQYQETENQIRAAMVVDNQNGSTEKVAGHLKKAIEYYSTDANLNNVYAATLLKLYSSADEDKSEQYLTEAERVLGNNKNVIHIDNEKAVHDLLRARLSVLKNNNKEAIEIYKSMTPTSDRMKTALASEVKSLKSKSLRKVILEKSKKTNISLTDMDIIDF